jgi:hypothetical protein
VTNISFDGNATDRFVFTSCGKSITRSLSEAEAWEIEDEKVNESSNAKINMTNKTIDALKAIFEKHKRERICVIGTMCCGKTTLVKQLSQYNCIDIDDELWAEVPEEEIKALSQTPITEEVSNAIYKLAYEKIAVKPGFPLFGFVILDCEVVVCLDISERLLEERCKKRGDTNWIDVLYLKKCIEKDLNNHKAKNGKVFYYLTITE